MELLLFELLLYKNADKTIAQKIFTT